MIFNISAEAYLLTGLGDCCTAVPAVEDAYCGTSQSGISGRCVLVAGAPEDVLCNVGAPTGTDCSAFNSTSTDPVIYVPVSVAQYVSSGSCTIEVTAEPGCGCPNSLPITQSIDVCDLAASAWEQLNPDVLNIFGSPCTA